jgi:hypothetical protein
MNELISQLLQKYAEENSVAVAVKDHNPFFTARVWACIRQEQQAQQFWEVGVISARKWLLGLSFVALLFFFGNLAAVGLQSQFSSRISTPSSGLDLEEGDYVEEALYEDVNKE